MTLDLYQVDAFARDPFTGNPAAVVPLDNWLPDEVLQNIAMENNLSETAYFVKTPEGYHIRWFTPGVEVRLCGHATLASAHVIFAHLGYQEDEIIFESKSGILKVQKKDKGYTLNFPSDQVNEIAPNKIISDAIGQEPKEWYRGKDDYLLVYESQDQIESFQPNFNALSTLKTRGFLVTAKGEGVFDFVSRGFFPSTGINEDPATGSAHTALTPYWSKRLNKNKLNACQLSKRKGYLTCENHGDRIHISGECTDYLIGTITI